ncbi:hypothetical protein SPRG_11509 [Saprolegnia parasitica CBS 223.65]|uniref:Uncharacterized protein n=1 Tax=Saprolegnia parasitica (strain CBS 223.65) TaxID=695850 RepID=A0A067CA42_SAPPC|nr:hypothetical protein SPRG_11509 [Saprolegnia parasitica CBS 223.65]KDO23416.1 hypothetical protein SPRG_11509 [Saprolegnia parasitica CBS 223.65]|eukprot:XP_012205904.1 hypothetical protein SPRG_11509 [Saprolegnia parasitica CBS 223.65]
MQSAIAYNQAQRMRELKQGSANAARNCKVGKKKQLTRRSAGDASSIEELEEDGSPEILLESFATYNGGDIPDRLLLGDRDSEDDDSSDEDSSSDED